MALLRLACRPALQQQRQITPATLLQTQIIQWRSATKRGGGSTRNGRDSAGRRLGLKKSDGQQVVAGNIIVRQRGYTIHPGQHVGVGSDHTLFALAPGFVKYYRATKDGQTVDQGATARAMRKYCGIVYDRDDPLPRNIQEHGRSRRLDVVKLPSSDSIESEAAV